MTVIAKQHRHWLDPGGQVACNSCFLSGMTISSHRPLVGAEGRFLDGSAGVGGAALISGGGHRFFL